MEKIILYSTGCPQCTVLKKKLDAANIEYELNTDQDLMLQLGFTILPILEVNGSRYRFPDAVKWLKEQTNGN